MFNNYDLHEFKLVMLAYEELHGDAIDNLEEVIQLYENGDFQIYYDCYTMTDVAEQLVEELDIMKDVPEMLQNYIDFESLGNDMESEGYYYEVEYHTYVQLYL